MFNSPFGMTNIDIDKLPVSTTAPADTDVIPTAEGMGGATPAIKRKAWSVFKAAIFVAIGGLTGKTTPVDADTTVFSDSAASGVGKSVTWANIKATLLTYFYTIFPNANGWMPATGTWTYASANTITVPSGAAAIYSVGDKWKVTANGVVLQGYIVSIADTVLTTAGNALTNHAFTLNYYSKAVSPVGFPQDFALTAPTWTSSGTAFTNQPSSNAFRFSIVGRKLMLNGAATMHATSGATGTFTATFATAELPVAAITSVGSVVNASVTTAGFSYIGAGTRAVIVGKDDASAIATNSQVIILKVDCFI